MNFIERTGRGITSSLLNVATPDNAQSQRDRGNQMIKNLSGGGAMLGGGVAAVVAAISLLNALKKEKEMDDDSRLDDDTLYISAPRTEKSASDAPGVSPLVAPGLAMSAGLVTTGASYALVQGIFNALEKRRRQQLLDQAQRDAIEASDEEWKKSAAEVDAKINLADVITASPIALPLLTMLATGGLTYATLDKAFPVVDRPKRSGPRRIRIGPDATPYEVPSEDLTDAAETDKSAAFEHADLDDAGGEFLASFVAAANPRTITNELICKAASGAVEEMERVIETAGTEGLMAVVKGAAELPVSSVDRVIGNMALHKSATLNHTVRAIAAAEYLETFGDSYREFSGCHQTMKKMAGLGCIMGKLARDSAIPTLEKFASELPEGDVGRHSIFEWLKGILSGNGQHIDQVSSSQREDRDAALNSDAYGGLSGAAEDDEDKSRDQTTGDHDAIDHFMGAGGEKSA